MPQTMQPLLNSRVSTGTHAEAPSSFPPAAEFAAQANAIAELSAKRRRTA
jgi:hypothetical protein